MENKCNHKDTRKMYYQFKNKWITTPFSICLACGHVVAKDVVEVLEGNKTQGSEK